LLKNSSPLGLIPNLSNFGENVQKPPTPGITATRAPDIPYFAGRPISNINYPL